MKDSTYYDEVFAKRGLRLPFFENHFATQTMRACCQQGHWLDLGCGCGQKAWHLARANPVEITGVEFSRVALQLALRLPPNRIRWARGNIMSLPFRSGSFDGVICSHVLEHVETLHSLLGEARRVTRPRGRLVVIVPHGHHHDDPSHQWHFTLGQLTSLLFMYGAVDVGLSPRGDQIAAVVHLGGIDED